jgi:hypothetical protein
MARRFLPLPALAALAAFPVVLSSCAGAQPNPVSTAAPKSSPTAAASDACAASVPLPEVLLEPGGVVLFGEVHGARELPAAFGDAVCSVAATGTPVEVGLEIPRPDQATLEAFLASPGSPSDIAALIATPFWTASSQDGRPSEARVVLLDRLRRMRAAGLPVSVFLFDIGPGEDVKSRDRLMADGIAARARINPQALTMVLVGEMHAWTTKGAFQPMGWYLASSGLTLHSLGRATPSGAAWVCLGPEPSDCGARDYKPGMTLPSGRADGVEMLPAPTPHGNDGLFGVASLTPSQPAVIAYGARP